MDQVAEKNLVEMRNVHRRFREGSGERVVLEGVSGTVRAGESVVLLGRSGSGKSTLLNIIAGIDRPDAGEVVIGGASLTGMDERQRTLFRRRHIGFVYQFFNLIPTLTVWENVCLPVELKGGTREAGRRRAAELLQAVDLADRADVMPDRLSGGEQQRVALARALAHDPLLVLADEPTGNLDADSGRRVIELLHGLVSGRGVTLITVTHSPELAERADRVLELKGGRLHETVREGR